MHGLTLEHEKRAGQAMRLSSSCPIIFFSTTTTTAPKTATPIYHVALILAFQQYFQTRGQIAVPNFIVFDQPSQVYFPHQNSQKEKDENMSISDEDKDAVKKIFKAMSDYLQSVKGSVQIIVTEHADEDIWGEIPSINLVERWRGNTQKLVPVEWLNT